MGEKSKAEIMADMSVTKAYGAFMSMNHSSADSKSVGFIQNTITGKDVSNDDAPNADLKGYAAVNKARDMLNSMMDEAVMKKELEGVRCSEFDIKQLKILRELEQDISFVNSEASGARSEVLRAQEVIQVVEETKLPLTRDALRQHNERCRIDLAMLRQQLAIVLSDIEVMKGILKMVCAEDVRTVKTMFLQTNTSDMSMMEDGELVQCIACGRQAVWLKHNKVQPMLAKLQSDVAKAYLEDNLIEEFGTNEHRAATVFISESEVAKHRSSPLDITEDLGKKPQFGGEACNEQMQGKNSTMYRGCQAETISGNTCQKWSMQNPWKHAYNETKYPEDGVGDHNFCRNPKAEKETVWCWTTNPEVPWEFCEPLLALKAPTGVSKFECKETNQCKLGKGQCMKLRDRFLNILAGIMDKKEELSNAIADLTRSCDEIRTGYLNSIAALEAQLKEEQTNLAVASKALSENMQQSALSNEQHQGLHGEYQKTMQECCDTKNTLSAEICALEKIRGELYKLKGLAVFMSDCEVSDWTDEECSVSCSGGKQKRERSILIHPVNGSKCPPLKMERSCNVEGCPIDCKLDDWSGWGDCTADCGSGVQTRTRAKTTEPGNVAGQRLGDRHFFHLGHPSHHQQDGEPVLRAVGLRHDHHDDGWSGSGSGSSPIK